MDRATGKCNSSVPAVPCLVDMQYPKGLIPVQRKERSALAHSVLCWAGKADR